ncbi:methyltransferase [Massilia sp. DWR3-1-1]|uniref:methyltransferase n=1 Tax=Massilia sp. DWR3-1-1 TaxID=2804559 RepID=UPI003CFA67C2
MHTAGAGSGTGVLRLEQGDKAGPCAVVAAATGAGPRITFCFTMSASQTCRRRCGGRFNDKEPMSKNLIEQNVFDLIQSSYTANTLFVLTKAGVFDRLLRQAASAAQLASELGLDASMLHDMLLFAHAVRFVKRDGATFSIARKALPLTGKSGSWLRAYLLVWGEQLNPAFSKLGEQLATGDNAFALANGKRIWDLYASDPEQNALFVEFMGGVTKQLHFGVVVEGLDIGGAQRLLDVGGGTGSFACGLAQSHPGLLADVCDQPSNMHNANAKIAALALQERCHFIGTNIFASIPSDYDLYTIKHVLHDWDDANAAAILRQIAEAMHDSARLVIIEGVLDRSVDEALPEQAYLHARNIEQRVWTPGRVRTRAAFDALCAVAGLRIDHVSHSTIFDISYLTCSRVPRPD